MTPGIGRIRIGLAVLVAAALSMPAKGAIRGTIKLPADMDEHNFADAAKLPMETAAKIAVKRAPGGILWAGLENLDGFLFYSVQVAARDGTIKMVTIDAGSGKVTGVESVTMAQEKELAAKEATDDAAKAKADPGSEEARKAKQAAQPDPGPRFHSSVTVPADADQIALGRSPKLSVFAAMAAARINVAGRIASVSLVSDHGNVYFAITVKEKNGDMTLVAVDAGNGQVLGTEPGG